MAEDLFLVLPFEKEREREATFKVPLHKVAIICNGCMSSAHTLSEKVTPSRKGTTIT